MTRKRTGGLTQTPGPSKRKQGRPPKRNNASQEVQDSSDDEYRPRHVLLEEEKNEEEFIEEGGTWVDDDIYIPPRITQVPHAGVGERLIIEKIVCENFKSYAGVKEMGPFHKNFTAIVGPNGNGKSNIIDAMLFVFGYKSTKIRCKKINALLHKSDLLPNVSSCSVTVHFGKIYDSGNSADQDGCDILPGTRIAVTRKATASGSSDYYLNGKKVKFQEVATFLKQNGIDIIHNRFLILQGEVESIAQMPPKAPPNGLEFGLMEYLEDIIGTRRYLKCLIKLDERVKELDFEREAKLHQVDLVEQEKTAMKGPVEKAKEYLRDVNSAIRTEHQLLQVTNHETRKELSETEQRKTKSEEALKTIMDRLGEIKATNDEKLKELQTVEKNFRQLDAEHKKQKHEMNNLESEFTRINEKLQRANTQRKKATSEIKRFESDLEKLDEIPAKYEEQMSAFKKRHDELIELCQTEEAKVEQLLSKLQRKIDLILKDKEEADKNLMTIKKTMNEKKSKVECAKSDLHVYKQQEEAERTKFDTYKNELEQLKENLKLKERENRSSSGNQTPDVLEEKLKQKEAEHIDLVRMEKAKADELSRAQSAFQENQEAFDGSATNDFVYKAFIQEKNRGRIAGLYGRLKDLATIDEKYNVAATVSSGKWEFWVCDTDETASQCIQILKDHRLPPQNFVCLNRISTRYGQALKAQFRCPSRSQRIFDLLKFNKPELAPAFYQALANTLVAENLQIASEMAYGATRFRVATLNGDLIDAQGSMSGGGFRKPTGKLNSGMAGRLANSVTSDQLKQHQAAIKQYQKEYEELFSKRQSLDLEIRHLTSEIGQKKLKLATYENDIKSLKSQISLKEKRLQEQEIKLNTCVTDPKILKEKEKVLKIAEKELEEIAGPCDIAEKEASKINEKLEDLQVTEKDEIKKKLNTFTEQKKKVSAEMNKQTVSMKNYEKNRTKMLTSIERLTNERETLQDEMKELSAKREELTEKAKGLNEILQKLEESKQEAKEELDKKKDESSVFRDEENSLWKRKAEIETKLSNIMNKFKGLQHVIKKNEDQLTNLKLHEIPSEGNEQVEPLQTYSEEDLETFRVPDLQHKLEKKQQKLEGKTPNLSILDAYKEKVDQFLREVEGLDNITNHRDRIRDALIKTETQRLSEFMEGYGIISSKLKEMFRMISMGGDAELDLLNKTDPFLEGVELCVRPANKAWKPIKHLSGGEKTLSSLALVFALHHFKPSPFYVMDEIDAALDFKNVSIIANYIKDRTKFTQFIIISLRSNMFELADSLLGVYKVDNMSQCVHMAVSTLVEKLKKRYEEKDQPFPLKGELVRLKI